MADEVGISPDSEATEWAISSTRLERTLSEWALFAEGPRLQQDRDGEVGEVCVRLEAQDVGHAVHLVAFALAFGPQLAALVEQLLAGHPFVLGCKISRDIFAKPSQRTNRGQLDFASKGVNVLEESGAELTSSGGGIRADGVDAVLGEFWVRAVDMS